jgi:hypothetical protein
MPPLALMSSADVETTVALTLALASMTLTSLVYLREHEAVAALPTLSLHRPLRSLRVAAADRGDESDAESQAATAG